MRLKEKWFYMQEYLRMKYSTFSNQNLIVRIRKQAVKGMPYHSSGLTIHAWNEDL